MPQMLAFRQVATSPLFLANLASFTLSVGLLLFATRHRESFASRWFAAWLVAIATWVGTHTFGLLVVDSTLRTVTDSLELALIVGASGCWLLFTLAYSGRWNGDRTPVSDAVAGVTAAFALFLLANPVHQIVHGVGIVEIEYGVATISTGSTTSAIFVVLGYVFALYIAGMIVLVDLVRSTSRLYRDQSAALVGAVALPLVVATLVMTGGVLPPVDLTPTSFALSSLPLTYAVFRSEVLGFVPASYRVGERTALETLDQGVLVRNEDGRVVFANRSAAAIIGEESDRLHGQSVEDVLERSSLDPVDTWIGDGNAERTDGGRSSVTEPDDGVPGALRDDRTGRIYRTFGAEPSEGGGTDAGRTLFLKDVTEERRRKERLLVLNRIVRHNLRNDMTVLRGHAELLEETLDDESVDVVDAIAADLQHLGEKAHEMDRLMRQAETEVDPVNVASVVDDVAMQVEADTEATVEVWGDVQAWTRTDSALIEAIVSNLVEIAVTRRSDGDERDDSPTVVVTVRTEDDTVTVTVEDDGPGIPEDEVRSLLDGEVSALQNGASIGLWVVKWCVDLADADWDIDIGEWTRVSVTFPSEPGMETSATGIGTDED